MRVRAPRSTSPWTRSKNTNCIGVLMQEKNITVLLSTMASAKNDTTKRNTKTSNGADPPPPQEDEEGRYYAIDIRVLLLMITLTMAASFVAGVLLIPPVTRTNATQEKILTAAELEEQEQHRPSGQHLLVDIKGVDSDFLNSEERLSTAMVDTVSESGLTMLSYHCHALFPSGVSCVGILLESHSKCVDENACMHFFG